MAEAVSFWICKCGKAVDNSESKCPNCGKSKPFHKRPLIWVASGAVVLTILVFITGDFEGEHTSISDNMPENQKNFNSIIENYSMKFKNETNPVEKEQILDRRNSKLANAIGLEGNIDRWVGTVRSIALLSDGASINIDIGHAELISGHSTSSNLRPSIRKGTTMYNVLSDLDKNEKVYLSGSFVTENGEGLSGLNWYHEGEAAAPEFHFSFTEIKPAKE